MIVLFNPLSTTPGKQPLPLSLMALAAVLEGQERWALVDGNTTADPAADVLGHLQSPDPTRSPALLAVTVMPGPQLRQAVDVCRAVRARLPHVPIVWGGYFPTQHTDTVLRSSMVDFAVRGQGERPMLDLVAALRRGDSAGGVNGLSWKNGDQVVHNVPAAPTPLDDLPDPPYARVDMRRYLHANYLGRRTVAYNSSFGCPFACTFCAVVAMSNRRWLAQSPARMASAIERLVTTYGVDAVQMHDMDFFISEARTAEFAERIRPLGIGWWGLGRVDTLMQYSDATWSLMARSGLKMVFSGAESASADTLRLMNKGGKAAPRLALELADRMRRFGIVPEYSFVLGAPPDPLGDLANTFDFVRRIKAVNPATEIVLYAYTPVPGDERIGPEAKKLGFQFPASLDEWASDSWRRLMLRRGDGVPWLDPAIRGRIRDFERVLNAFYPTVTDRRLTGIRRVLLRSFSAWRYALKVYAAPYELRALHRLFRYQRPETTGF
jgi:hypothetical protein